MAKLAPVVTFTSPEVNPTAPPTQKNGAHPSARPQTHVTASSPTAAAIAAKCSGLGTANFTPTKFGYSVRRRSIGAVTFGSRRYGTIPSPGRAFAIAA